MNSYIFHISLYDLVFLAAITIGLTFALLLMFTKPINQSANRFLALALIATTVWLMRVLAIDINLNTYLPHWDRVPMQYLLAVGPLIYFYVLKLTRPPYKFKWKDLLHTIPLLLEQAASAFEINENTRTGKATYETQIFLQWNPVLQLLIFVSIIIYVYWSYKLVQNFYTRSQPVLMDRSLLEFRWLRRLLMASALLWLCWFVFAAVDCLGYHNEFSTQIYYPFYLLFAVIMIWMAMTTFLRSSIMIMSSTPLPTRKTIPAELRAKGIWLKKQMEAEQYHQDPELKLGGLAEKLGLTTHELSRIINTGLKKSFNDFINEYRVREVARKMQNPAYDHFTLLGIAYESGFNSQTSFTRILKQITGKTPSEYKNELQKNYPSYNLGSQDKLHAVISSHHISGRNYLFKMNFMLKNYWIVAWRSLLRNKVYSIVNVLGLSLGICACLAIYLITRYEYSFDNFHPDNNRIFCVDAVFYGGHWNCVPGPLPSAMRREITGLQTVAAFQSYDASVTIPGGDNEKLKVFDESHDIIIAEPQYFNIFQYKWLSGNAATSLAMPNSVVLTAEKARKYFGDIPPEQAIGRTIYYQDSLMVRVTGVVEDWTGNSDFNFSQWISYATIPASFLRNKVTLDNWDILDRSSQVIIKLAKGIRPQQVDAQFNSFAKQHFGPKQSFAARLQPLSGSHFHQDYGGTGRKASLPVLYTLIMVAALVLILAIVNFVNLSTAQSIQRAREIGVRKVLGGSRLGISIQFFTETLLLTLAAVVVAAVLVNPLFGIFPDLVPAGVHFQLTVATLLFLSLIVAVTTLLAGFYPARVLGNYQPTVTLKGITAMAGGGRGTLRKTLIVFQFAISLLFIIASVVIGAQLRYVLHANLGFKTEAIVTLGVPHENKFSMSSFAPDGKKSGQTVTDETVMTAALMEKLRQLVGVEQVVREWRSPMDRLHSGFSGSGLKGSDEKPIDISLHYGDAGYINFYGIKLVAGRNLLPGDSSRELLISETAARALGFADMSKVIGREVLVGPGEAYSVAGVVADFYENSFHQVSWPVGIRHNPKKETTIALKIAAESITAGDLKVLMEHIKDSWKTVFPGKPFAYSFLDERIANMYADDLRTERLTNLAMGITVFISCLGLLGLAIFSTERRTREIGIRKVLGASVSGIIAMLCKEIVLLVVLALLIASPLAWYLMRDWLQGFAYRTALSGWMFIAAGAAGIGIALLTVGFQAMRAAMANPVNSLRTE